MSALSYNCRGVGGAATVGKIHDLAKKYAPTILFLLETQLHKRRVEGLARTLCFDKGFAVSSSGRSGGMGMFWNNNTAIEILPYSQYHIDAVVREGERTRGVSRGFTERHRRASAKKRGIC